MPNVNVEDESSNALFIAVDSVDNLIHDNDGDYYVFNAVINGEIKTVKVDQNVKVVNAAGVTTTLTSAQTKNVDGLFKGYSVDKYGIITTLRAYDTYHDNTDKKVALTGVGIDKVSKEYTVKLDTANVEQVITCDDNMKVYYVDEDGNISESSYGAIAVDSNDRVYAVVQDYLVKTLVICEVPAGKVDNNNVVTGESYTMRSTVASNGNYRVQVDYTRPSYVPATSTVDYTFDILEDGMWFKTVTGTLAANKTRITDTGVAFNPDCELTIANVKFTPAKISVKYIDETTKADVTKAFTATGVASTDVIANDGTGAVVSVKLPAAYAAGTGFVVSNIVDANGKATTETKTAALSTSSAVATSAAVIPAADDFVVVTVKGLAKAEVKYSIDLTEVTSADIEDAANDKLTITASKTSDISAGTNVTFKVALGAAPQDAASYTVTAKINGKTYTAEGVKNATGVELCTIAVDSNITVKADDVTVVAVPKLAVKSASWTDTTLTIVFNEGTLNKVKAEDTAATSYDVTIASGATVKTAEVEDNVVTLTFVDGLLAAGDTVEVKAAVGLAADKTITLAAGGTATIA